MLNLLSQEQKAILKKDYSLRRTIVWLEAIIVAMLISLVLLTPSYFLTKIRAEQAKVDLENNKRILDAKLPPAEMVAEIQAAVRVTQDLRPLVERRSVYDLVKIFESHPPQIKILKISFLEQTDGISRFIVDGRANDRESLTAFGRALEGRVEFATVDLPVSNFVKESNINFSMTITLK